MNDLTLNLPEGVRLNSLEVTSEFSHYSELLQRVVMLILTSDHEDLKIDGKTLPEFFRTANMQGITVLNSQLIFVATAAKELLNSDSYEVENLTISATGGDGAVQLVVTVSGIDGNMETGEFTI